jgi:hypothetical protein
MSEMNQRLPGNSLTRVVLSRLFNGLPYSGSNARVYRETLEMIAAKLRKKKLLSKLIQSGRANDSRVCFEQAIALGSFSARAELSLLGFNQNLAFARFWLFNQNLANADKKAFELVKEGHEIGCSDCSGMLAHIYVNGFRGFVVPSDETAYRLACASADAGSWFGKMALAHFLKGLLGPIDPDEETFYVLWSDPFIRNFASPSIDVPAADDVLPVEVIPAEDVPVEDVPTADFPVEDVPVEDEDPFKDWSESDLEDWFGVDENILMQFDIHRIARLLIAEIQQERACNPNSPKVWLNLPAL